MVRTKPIRKDVMKQRNEIDKAEMFKWLQNDKMMSYGMFVHLMPLVGKVDFFTLKTIDTL